MMENGGGSIVNITSQFSEVTSRDFAHYSVTKAGGKMLTKDMAFDIAKKDVRVNTIGPGPTETGMTLYLENDRCEERERSGWWSHCWAWSKHPRRAGPRPRARVLRCR